MKKKGVTKYYLAEHCGVNNNTLHKLRHDKPLNTTTVERLCEILDCNVQDIMTYEKAEESVEIPEVSELVADDKCIPKKIDFKFKGIRV
jgi:DNA-binding Xre family transcriptional regulator